jgi:hypothetical protein
MAELVTHGSDGLLFEPGNEADLAAQVAALSADPIAMRAKARQTFENKYTAEQNYPALMSIYEAALNQAASRSTRTTAAHLRHAPIETKPLNAAPCGRSG